MSPGLPFQLAHEFCYSHRRAEDLRAQQNAPQSDNLAPEKAPAATVKLGSEIRSTKLEILNKSEFPKSQNPKCARRPSVTPDSIRNPVLRRAGLPRRGKFRNPKLEIRPAGTNMYARRDAETQSR